MDKSVTRTLALRAWNVVAGFLVVVLVPFYLSPEAQGFYYSFSSVLAIQIFFELGLGQVLVYRFSALSSLRSNPASVERLYQLLYASRFIYRFIALAFFVVALVAGWAFFASIPAQSVAWLWPWALLVAATSINLLQSIKLVFLEATGHMNHVSIARLRASIVSSLLFVIVLSSGGSLWAAVVTPAATALYTSIWIYRHRNSAAYRDARDILKPPVSSLVTSWKQDILPMQWRISLSWLSGYFIFQLYTPIALRQFGPIAAGRLGYIISIMTSLLFVATTFTSALAPRLSALFSSGQISQFNRLFDQSLKASIFALIFAVASVLGGVKLVDVYYPQFADRLLPLTDSLIYGLISILSGIVYCLSIYLRSQQREPLLGHALVTSAFMFPVLVFSSRASLTIMLFSALVFSSLSFAWACDIYFRNRKSVSPAI